MTELLETDGARLPAALMFTVIPDLHPCPTPALEPGIATRTDVRKGSGRPYPDEMDSVPGMPGAAPAIQVHSNNLNPFLRKSNKTGALFLTCHSK